MWLSSSRICRTWLTVRSFVEKNLVAVASIVQKWAQFDLKWAWSEIFCARFARANVSLAPPTFNIFLRLCIIKVNNDRTVQSWNPPKEAIKVGGSCMAMCIPSHNYVRHHEWLVVHPWIWHGPNTEQGPPILCKSRYSYAIYLNISGTFTCER